MNLEFESYPEIELEEKKSVKNKKVRNKLL
jgi:hypothetical protein